uniref:Secreted protein n=1 Tax=Ascaris lumbricoides TaxID=6252 RepID=A0A0M3IH45_ASCLU
MFLVVFVRLRGDDRVSFSLAQICCSVVGENFLVEWVRNRDLHLPAEVIFAERLQVCSQQCSCCDLPFGMLTFHGQSDTCSRMAVPL